ncbi:hypothetical protein [Kocuria massiliensis]|uniref:hypothetical protein n=1 Tax=Kocuria massiliensis TaxID=1926282 RepID=UPI00117BC386|nr:hypothetical protein [Kocuria massiliensis]
MSNTGRVARAVGINAGINGGTGAVSGGASYSLTHMNNWNAREFAGSIAGGGLAGAGGGLARPGAGSIAQQVFKSGTSGKLATKVLTPTIESVTSVAGTKLGNDISGNKTSMRDVTISATTPHVGKILPNAKGPNNDASIKQFARGNPSTISGAIHGVNGPRAMRSALTSNAWGVGLDVGKSEVLEKFTP